jgi:hypothetical protein
MTVRSPPPASLDSRALARRLGELAGSERSLQVEFLLHLVEFDRRRAYLHLGFPSLWEYCVRDLHLREGAAARRIRAMHLLRQFPELEAPLRDGRLCLSTAPMLAPVLTSENLDDLVARAAYRTKAEVDQLIASLRPREAPRNGLRRLPSAAGAETVRGSGDRAGPVDCTLASSPRSPPGPSPEAAAPQVAKAAPCSAMSREADASAAMPLAPDAGAPDTGAADTGAADTGAADTGAAAAASEATAGAAAAGVAGPTAAASAGGSSQRTSTLVSVAATRWSLRVTIDEGLKDDLETLRMLLSHKVRTGDLAEVLREAVRCGIEKHGKRKGAVTPAPKRSRAAEGAEDPRYTPAALRRAVWKRDRGCCTWTGEDGRRCGSRWQVEIDHIVPPPLGGKSTLTNLRLLCRKHNLLHAEQVYGRGHMQRFRRPLVPVAMEAEVEWAVEVVGPPRSAGASGRWRAGVNAGRRHGARRADIIARELEGRPPCSHPAGPSSPRSPWPRSHRPDRLARPSPKRRRVPPRRRSAS